MARKQGKSSSYDRIYTVIREIPPGTVTTYGRVARLAGGCTPRMVGYALAASTAADDLPWFRVINHQGRISDHGAGAGSRVQRRLLEEEGVRFDARGQVDLERFGWPEREPMEAPRSKSRKASR